MIDGDSRVKRFFNAHKNGVSRFLESLDLDEYELFLLKCVVAVGQEHVLSSVECELESSRSSLKSALYALVEMIEKLDVTTDNESLGRNFAREFPDEEVGVLMKLLKTLREMDRFYDCIGGIIGLVFF